MNELRFCWWNVCDYAEYVAEEDKRPNRGPTSEAAYDEKSRRVIAAFDAMYGPLAPELLGLCELTPAAARRLQAVRFPNHELVLSAPDQPTRYQIAVLHRTGVPFARRLQYVAGDVPRTTRPMTVIDFRLPWRRDRVRILSLDRVRRHPVRGIPASIGGRLAHGPPPIPEPSSAGRHGSTRRGGGRPERRTIRPNFRLDALGPPLSESRHATGTLVGRGCATCAVVQLRVAVPRRAIGSHRFRAAARACRYVLPSR